MDVLLGLVSALCFGAGDFTGGLASRKASAIAVTLASQLIAVAFIVGFVVLVPSAISVETVAIAVGAGVCQALGLVLLYRVLALGAMGILTAVTAVMAALVPLVWTFVNGERLTLMSSLGITIGLVAVFFAGQGPGDVHDAIAHRRHLALAATGGAIFGVSNAFVGNFPTDEGTGALLVVRLAAIAFLLPLAFYGLDRTVPVPWSLLKGPLVVLTGVTTALGGPLFFWAADAGSLAVAAVVVGLAPLATTVLARSFLRQHLTRAHVIGLGLGFVSVSLLVVG